MGILSTREEDICVPNDKVVSFKRKDRNGIDEKSKHVSNVFNRLVENVSMIFRFT